jgi:hypothetical protein
VGGDPEPFETIVFHKDLRAEITGNREARKAGRKLPMSPITREKARPNSIKSGVTRNWYTVSAKD